MARFYLNGLLNVGETISLPLELVRHIQVLRLRLDEEIVLFNGDGYGYVATITSLEKKLVTVNVISIQNHVDPCNDTRNTLKHELNLHLAIGIIANDKMDLVISSATQLGVTEITPIISAYSQKISVDKISSRLEHWQKIGISACEQCGRNRLPQINLPINFNDFIKVQPSAIKSPLADVNKNKETLKLILSPTSNNYLDRSNFGNTKPICIQLLIGSEGGFSQNEIELAMTNGYMAICLWQNILRSETAVVAGIAAINTKILG